MNRSKARSAKAGLSVAISAAPLVGLTAAAA